MLPLLSVCCWAGILAMKTFTPPVVAFFLLLLIVFLCGSNTLVTAEDGSTGKIFRLPIPEGNATGTTKPNKTLHVIIDNEREMKIIEAAQQFKQTNLILENNNPQVRSNSWGMPQMNIRNDIDYKIQYMSIDPAIDYKILVVDPGKPNMLPNVKSGK